MNVYFDTSAFVPLLMEEPTSDAFGDLWSQADRISSTRLLFVEASAALEKARRAARISDETVTAMVGRLEQLWTGVVVIELNEQLMFDASVMASRFGLRGYDAVHCAAGYRMSGADTIAASGDARLNEVWSDLGLATYIPKGRAKRHRGK